MKLEIKKSPKLEYLNPLKVNMKKQARFATKSGTDKSGTDGHRTKEAVYRVASPLIKEFRNFPPVYSSCVMLIKTSVISQNS